MHCHIYVLHIVFCIKINSILFCFLKLFLRIHVRLLNYHFQHAFKYTKLQIINSNQFFARNVIYYLSYLSKKKLSET